jgi:hypothetical protein
MNLAYLREPKPLETLPKQAFILSVEKKKTTFNCTYKKLNRSYFESTPGFSDSLDAGLLTWHLR